jgi:Spondin-like TSP1 domain/Thrombospondin type 1 domain
MARISASAFVVATAVIVLIACSCVTSVNAISRLGRTRIETQNGMSLGALVQATSSRGTRAAAAAAAAASTTTTASTKAVTGIQCSCSIKSTQAGVRVEAWCEAQAGLITTKTCKCLSSYVPCEANVRNSLTLEGAQLQPPTNNVCISQQMTGDSYELACAGAACPLKAFHTKITLSHTIEDERNQECSSLTHYEPCTMELPCNCIAESQWSSWSSCTSTNGQSCGNGQKVRTRSRTQYASFNGTECAESDLKQTKSCYMGACPIDCIVDRWINGTCNTTCGAGLRCDNLRIVSEASNGGTACPTERTRCTTCSANTTCPKECVLSEWSSWSSCSEPCGGGSSNRTRTLVTPATNGGSCGDLFEQKNCNEVPCSANCTVGQWSGWTTCSVSCDGGFRTRNRTVTVQKMGDGTKCPDLYDSEDCNTAPCSKDCVLDQWTAWSTCSATCGDAGYKMRNREVISHATGSGKDCAALGGTQETTPCAAAPKCNCTAHWSNWSTCVPSAVQLNDSLMCYPGIQRRTVSSIDAASDGTKCNITAEHYQERPCGAPVHCPIHCVMNEWTAWSLCAPCGHSQKQRTRTIKTQPQYSGEACGATEEQQDCLLRPCDDFECIYSAWGGWTDCDSTCESGSQSHYRSANRTAMSTKYGADIEPLLTCDDTVASRTCNTQPCDKDCVVSQWSSWGDCNTTCGGGVRHAFRSISQNATGNGNCTSLVKTEPCGTADCPVDCVVSQWSDWSSCPSCGEVSTSRYRNITTPAHASGAPCPELLLDTKSCEIPACAVTPCVYSTWSTWSNCPASDCVGVLRQRERSIVKEPTNGGQACGNLTESLACRQQDCAAPDPINCLPGPWSAWSSCSKTCGLGGTRNRTRSIARNATNGGHPCTSNMLADEESCNGHPCPVDCVVVWSNFSLCSAQCGGGTRQSLASVKQQSIGTGTKCPGVLIKTEDCNTQACPVNCAMNQWSEWTLCSLECGAEGTQTRSRTVRTQAQHGGTACSTELSQNRECNRKACPPAACVTTPFGSWTECDKPCGGGFRHRTRTVISGQGPTCPRLEDIEECNVKACPDRDCKVSDWSDWSKCDSGKCAQTRSRTVTEQVVNHGKACPALEESRKCQVHVCGAPTCQQICSKSCAPSPVKVVKPAVPVVAAPCACACNAATGTATAAKPDASCNYTPWGVWSACYAPGKQSRYRHALGQPSCPMMADHRPCTLGIGVSRKGSSTQQSMSPIIASASGSAASMNAAVASAGANGLVLQQDSN